jgi:hypothetical protein
MNPDPGNPQLTDADFDRALLSDHDAILPSSGFTDFVMAAVTREAAAPAPIAFPWERALPGLVAIAATGVILLVAVVVLLRSIPAATAGSPSMTMQAFPAPILHHASDVFWLSFCLVVSAASLLFCRRLTSPR